MICTVCCLLAAVVALLYYHEVIFSQAVTIKNMKGFNFIYKEYRSKYDDCGTHFEKFVDLLKKNAKNIKTYVVSGNHFSKRT